jgi:proline iminopeptidase
LELTAGHRLYYEQWGRKDAPVALVLHGGPGSGFSERLLSFFDLDQFRVVAFDQRGCGRSSPRGACSANTTDHLLADMERLRQTLGVTRWLVVGGSWGATLGLAYATRCRERVTGLLLRAFFWPGPADIESFFADRPWRQWAVQLAAPSVTERHAAALAWWHWELSRSGTHAGPALSPTQLDALCDRYRVQAHYLLHGCWLGEAALGRGVLSRSDLPIQFLHGSADQVCPPAGARRVHEWLKGSDWRTVSGAGHDPFHPAMEQAMRETLRQFGETGQFRKQPSA